MAIEVPFMSLGSSTLTNLSPEIQQKLEMLREKLNAADLDSALDKSLNIANYIADTVHDPNRKLLVETDGKFTEVFRIN